MKFELEPINGDLLAKARRRKSQKEFESLLSFYRKRGFTDAEIVKAMAESRIVINPIRLLA